MKSIIFILSMMMSLLFWSCQNYPLSDEQIAFNLSKKGKNNPELLVGEWDCMKFAYTEDGNKITNVKDISNLGFENNSVDKGFLAWYKVGISNLDAAHIAQMVNDAPLGLFGPLMFGTNNHFYLISDNLMFFSRFSDYVYAIALTETNEVRDVQFALRNTYSYVVKGNELIIHFKGVEKRNLLILEKR